MRTHVGHPLPCPRALLFRIAPVLVHHGLVAEELGIAAVDGGEFLDVAFEEALCLWGDERLEGHLLDALEVVAPTDIHVPTPIFKETDVEGIGRTIERTAHAHQATMVEGYFSLLVAIDVLHGATLDAEIAVRTLVLIHLIQEGIDGPAYILRPSHHARHETRPELIGLPVGDAVEHLIDHDFQQLLVHLQHLANAGILEAEMDVVRHHEMVLVLHADPIATELPQEIL